MHKILPRLGLGSGALLGFLDKASALGVVLANLGEG
jgi:hypothetical protein